MRNRRCNDDWDEVIPEDPADELLDLLRDIERRQKRLAQDQRDLHRLIEREPDLRQKWHEFTRMGGISANELELFLQGRLRPRITHQRRHLRLVPNRKLVNRGHHYDDDPDEAA
jgi:hypothetical protein